MSNPTGINQYTRGSRSSAAKKLRAQVSKLPSSDRAGLLSRSMKVQREAVRTHTAITKHMAGAGSPYHKLMTLNTRKKK